MPPLMFAVAAGAGLYLGLRSLQRRVTARQAQSAAEKPTKSAAGPESAGQLQWDDTAKVYRVTPTA